MSAKEGIREQLQAEVLAHAETARERDRLRAVAEAARRWRAAAPGHESAVAIQALYEALDAEGGT